MPTEEQTYRSYVKEKLDNIETKVTYTNGKVKKIIIALTLLFGVVIGQALTPAEIIRTLFHIAL
jgi:tetrahydromethanopterin S-methyltransferase subunit G